MKVFSDLHHEDLYYSLQLLFEKRLGAELYRPIGLEWYEQNYWSVYKHPATAQQYLSVDNIAPMDVHGVSVLDSWGEDAWINKDSFKSEDGVYIIPDRTHLRSIPHRGITLAKFKEMKFDILVCSIPDHIPIWKELKRLYQPQAKIIFQSGNNWTSVDCDNLLTSSIRTTNGNKHRVFYRQEFDTEVFSMKENKNVRSISNFQHLASSSGQLIELGKLLPDFEINVWGAGNRDGPCQDIQTSLPSTGFLWHVKPGGDGYGYNLHEAASAGIPLIVDSRLIIGTTSEALCEWGKTAIDINGKSLHQIAIEVKTMTENYTQVSSHISNRFKNVVDFDREYVDVKKFLDNLI